MSVVVKRVELPQELWQVQRFRYQHEAVRGHIYADHQARVILEPFDDTATIMAAFRGEEVVGTVRSNYLRDLPGAMWLEFGLAKIADAALDSICQTSGLLVAPLQQRSLLLARLVGAIYRHLNRSGVAIDFINCGAEMVPDFLKLGYRPLCGRAVPSCHTPAQIPLMLLVGDIDHFRAIGSPLLQLRGDNHNQAGGRL